MNNNIVVSFSVAANKYAEYKEILKKDGRTPANDLKKHIYNEILKYNTNFNGYKIVYCNLCSNKSAIDSLNYFGTEKERMERLAEVCLEYLPDIIVVNEISPIKSAPYIEKLELVDYVFIYPKDYNVKKDKRKTCITAVAIKKGLKFTQEFSIDTELEYRYVKGTVCKTGEEELHLLGVHIPTVDMENPVRKQEVRKEEMFSLTESFVNECYEKNVNGIQIGDYNTALIDNYYCQERLKCLSEKWVDTSIDREITWGKARIDYCFANQKLLGMYDVETETVDKVVSNRLTDHCILVCKVTRK